MPHHRDALALEPNPAVDFRRTLGHFCSGIVVVTAIGGDGAPVGLTCQSFFSLSLDPPLVAFSPALTSGTYAHIRRAGAFCINILEERQQAACANFARKDVDRWESVGWDIAATGSPVLDGVLAWIDCRFEAEHVIGDHYLVVGRIAAMGTSDDPTHRPLLYYKGAYGGLRAPG